MNDYGRHYYKPPFPPDNTVSTLEKLAAEMGHFSLNDAAVKIVAKLVRAGMPLDEAVKLVVDARFN